MEAVGLVFFGFVVIEQRSFLCCFNFGRILILTKLAKIFSMSKIFAAIKFRVIKSIFAVTF